MVRNVAVGLFGMFILAVGVCRLWNQNKLKRECTAQAVGVAINFYSKSGLTGKRTTYHYFVEFKYSVEGVDYVNSVEISSEYYDSTGMKVTVFYDPSDPQRSYTLEEKEVSSPQGLILSGVIVCIISICLP